MVWIDIVRISLAGAILGLIIGKIIVEKPRYLIILHPRYWISSAKRTSRERWIQIISIGIIFAGLITIIGGVVSEFVTSYFGPAMTEENIFTHIAGVSVILLYASIIILPIFEEWIFRRILLEEITQWKNSRWWGLILSSIIFALFHLSNPGTLPVAAIPLIIGGLILGGCYLVGGLAAAILAHILYNVFPSILFLLSGLVGS